MWRRGQCCYRRERGHRWHLDLRQKRLPEIKQQITDPNPTPNIAGVVVLESSC